MRKLAAAAVAMTLCLSLMSLGYAWWSENLNVAGTVNTGDLDWEFAHASVRDTTVGFNPDGDETCDPTFTVYGWTGKDVARGSASISADRNTVTFTLHNAYPSYLNALTARVRNTGTIPLRFERVLIKDHDGVTRATFEGPPYHVVNLDLTGEGTNDVALLWGDNLGEELGLGHSITNTFEILVLAGAPEDETLSFSVELVGVQYNAP